LDELLEDGVRAVVYTRNGGHRARVSDCRAHAERQGYVVVDVVDDRRGAGATADYGRLADLIERIAAEEIKVVITGAAEDISRETGRLGAYGYLIEQAGARVEFVAGGGAGISFADGLDGLLVPLLCNPTIRVVTARLQAALGRIAKEPTREGQAFNEIAVAMTKFLEDRILAEADRTVNWSLAEEYEDILRTALTLLGYDEFLSQALVEALIGADLGAPGERA
jgi:hypothetical protein